MDQAIRNKLRGVVTQCRKLLEDTVSQELQGKFGIYAAKKDAVQIDDDARMTHLSPEDRASRKDILDHFEHIKARGFKPKDAFDQLVREIAFTHLNRFCAYKMMEARQVYVGDQKFREAVGQGVNSNGVKFYLADHPEDERLYNTGKQDVAYRHFLDWLGGLLSEEIGVLFSPTDPANRLFPPQRVLDDVVALLNSDDLKDIWAEDETIGWVYQYFTPKELRDQARKESAAPRNSYELAFRNQFFTPRYVVEFLTDNTLGRIWYEMRKGDTKLKDQCRYMVRRPGEVFFAEGQSPPEPTQNQEELSQEELLKQPVHIPHRPKKDPRELRILDPACGSGHFLLYCFALLLTIYEEAYADPDLGPKLKEDYSTLEDLRRDLPRLILAHNLHGIDIDLRASQIAALALWLRCQRAYREMGLKQDRSKITRSNIVCAEPMPGEKEMLDDFLKTLKKDRLEALIGKVMQVPEESRVRATESMVESLNELVRFVWDKMQLAGEAGSLLKIEEELQEAIRKGQEEWEEKQPLFRFTEFSLTEKPKESYIRFVPGEGVSFWQRAEVLVLEALRDYTRHAANGGRLQRQLFAEDAERGFAFIDVCQKRFDVVLMNPPFGEFPKTASESLHVRYPEAQKYLYGAFSQRAIGLAHPHGTVGALANRGGFFISTYEGWRDSCLLGDSTLELIVDLGYSAIDEAVVELTAYVVSYRSTKCLIAFNLLDIADQKAFLDCVFSKPLASSLGRQVLATSVSSFVHLPTHPICYWIPESVRLALTRLPKFQQHDRTARQGLATTDDFRFLRLAWEVPPQTIGKGNVWSYFVKGGEYCPFYDDVHLVIKWQNDGQELKEHVETIPGNSHWSRRIANVGSYYQWGVTYPETTVSDFAPRVMPTDCIFSATGQAIFFPRYQEAFAYLGIALSSVYKLLLELFVGSGGAAESGGTIRHYKSGLLNMLPYPPEATNNGELSSLGRECVVLGMEALRTIECTRLFLCPFAGCTPATSLRSLAFELTKRDLQKAGRQFSACAKINALATRAYGFDDQFKYVLDEWIRVPLESLHREPSIDGCRIAKLGRLPIEDLVDHVAETVGARRQVTKLTYWADCRIELLALALEKHPGAIIGFLSEHPEILGEGRQSEVARSIVSYSVGVTFGVWDIRLAVGSHEPPQFPEPFDSLPACPIGSLQNGARLPATCPPEGYPVRIDWDGIISDDPDHSDDIVRRVRDVLELIWKDQAEAIEKEACEILGVRELRDCFRKPGKGGFWDDHVSRYSKSRRKAPIYWLLQSSKKNYALWLYYHRLDKDILFKALVSYVEPKVQRETNRLDELRRQKEAAGTVTAGPAPKGRGGSNVKKLDKEIERQEDLISELRDFEDKLRRAANLHLEPDLNDGVVLNIAPLHELVPWKLAKDYWDELLEGKYEWFTIAKQLRQKGVVA